MRKFVLVEDDEELMDVSSTEIRQMINDTTYTDMVTKGWITSDVADYLEANKSKVLICKNTYRPSLVRGIQKKSIPVGLLDTQ